MKFILNFFKGILIGAGAILPGISSGVMCVIFGIYDKLLDSILNFFKNIKRNFIFLFPILLGVFVGVILLSKVLKFLLETYPLQTKSIFIGLIIGGVILLFRQILSKQKPHLSNFIFLSIALIFGILMVYLENIIVLRTIDDINFTYLLLSGFLMSIGIVVPGVSSTIILMLLGTYSLYLSSISTLYFPTLIPIGIGIFIGSLIFMKVIKILLDRYNTQTMFTIVGFTIGSVSVLFPPINNVTDIIISLICVFIGFSIMNFIKNDKS